MRPSLLAACSLVLLTATSTSNAADVAVPAFYRHVATLKADQPLGTVVAKEPVATQIPGAEAWRIAYVSSDALERRTLSTALVIAPKGRPPHGGRPIVAWAHGTTGTAQNCGPSQVEDPAQEINEYNLIGGTSWTDFGVPAVNQLIKSGYVVVATDYQGLGGGGGFHQYAVVATQGRDIINSVRAVGSLKLSGGAKKAVAYGWSQGGGAVLGAASMGGYIGSTGTAFDGVQFVGFVALAPHEVEVLIPPEATTDDAAAQKLVGGLANMFSDSAGNFAHYAMTMWATAVAYPELKLTDLFTDDGATALNEIFSKKCMHPGADTIAFSFGNSYRSLLKSEPTNATAWMKRLVDGSVTQDMPVAPVIIYFGDKDVTNNPIMGQLYQERRCAKGANVARVQLPGEQNHFTTPGVSEPLLVPWIADRFAGKPAANGCPAH